MSRTLTLELSDESYALLRRSAEANGRSPAQWVADSLERQFGLPRHRISSRPADMDSKARVERFESHFGEIDLGAPTGSDNESIDLDLAREFARGLGND